MRLLLDTHTLLWALGDPDRLHPSTRALLEDSTHEVFVSAASLWEIAIKVGLGKLVVPDDLERALFAVGFQALEIRFPHVRAVRTLPAHHRDPFDRLLVAQALHENLVLVTRDARIPLYGVEVITA
jgi:PIN domain nuclease of toxin-antitoxin system